MPASVRDSGKFLQEEDGAAGPVVDGFRVHSLQVRTSVFTEAIRNGNLPVSLFGSLSAIFIERVLRRPFRCSVQRKKAGIGDHDHTKECGHPVRQERRRERQDRACC